MKKKPLNPAQTDRLWALTSDPYLEKVLHHLLSPLEMEALRHRFKEFTYDMDGVKLFVDSHACGMMLFSAKLNVKSHYELLRLNKVMYVKKKDRIKRIFLNSRPSDHPEIPSKIATQLEMFQLKRMEDIAVKGSYGITGYTRIGQKSVSVLIPLFEKYGCDDIFVTTKYK